MASPWKYDGEIARVLLGLDTATWTVFVVILRMCATSVQETYFFFSKKKYQKEGLRNLERACSVMAVGARAALSSDGHLAFLIGGKGGVLAGYDLQVQYMFDEIATSGLMALRTCYEISRGVRAPKAGVLEGAF